MAERILIVDDDPVQRRLIENLVARFGYEAVAAEGGQAAVRMLLAGDGPRVDCVILDLVMPDLDGLGVLARMRAAGCSVPVIVATAHGGIDNVVSAMRAGAIDFVVKPASASRSRSATRSPPAPSRASSSSSNAAAPARWALATSSPPTHAWTACCAPPRRPPGPTFPC